MTYKYLDNNDKFYGSNSPENKRIHLSIIAPKLVSQRYIQQPKVSISHYILRQHDPHNNVI